LFALCVCVHTRPQFEHTTQCQVLRPELSQYTWYSYHNAWLHFWSCGRLARQERPPNTESRSLVTIHSTVSSLRELVPAKLWSCPPNMANYFRAIRFGSYTKLIDHAVLVRSTTRISLILLLVVGSQPNRKELGHRGWLEAAKVVAQISTINHLFGSESGINPGDATSNQEPNEMDGGGMDTLVVDVGSGTTRCGPGGADLPSEIFPSAVGPAAALVHPVVRGTVRDTCHCRFSSFSLMLASGLGHKSSTLSKR
jgi:hypothetical protein